jgi:bifunctional non-homologous end joining protein LigD
MIPKGNYGAGTVMVWDEGAYHSRQTPDRTESERILKEGLQKGHITFVVYGRKLKGELALVKLRKGEENGWLLLKKRDEFATNGDVTEFDRSVASNRTLEEIAESALQAGEVWPARKKLPVLDLSGAPESSMPHRVRPMLATTVEKPFNRSGWLFEIKWDGYRAIAEVENQVVRLYSRNQLSLEDRFATLVQSLQGLGCTAVLDGEVVVVDETGKPCFQLLQNYVKSREGQVVYYVFDLLYLNGHDVRKLPLTRRKELLRQILPDLPHVQMRMLSKIGLNFGGRKEDSKESLPRKRPAPIWKVEEVSAGSRSRLIFVRKRSSEVSLDRGGGERTSGLCCLEFMTKMSSSTSAIPARVLGKRASPRSIPGWSR